MKGNARDLDQVLDQALAGIRDEALEAAAERAAADRVLGRVRRELEARPEPREERHRIRDCSDFQALIPAHLQGGLNEAKRLLLQDHLTECVPCRRALVEARDARRKRRVGPEPPREGRGRVAVWTWRLAVAAIIVIALVGLSVRTEIFTLRTGGLIRIESVEGKVFKVSDEGSVPVSAGDTVSFEDTKLLRTGDGSSAMLRLPDRSRVEVNERAELSVFERRKMWSRRSDPVIDLGRGSVIVEASAQGAGRLYVDTPDASVAVAGTVFAVNHGIKGSRVSVLEGSVRVTHAGDTDVLRPGQQTTSNPGLARIPIAREIAWSKQLDKHLALLQQFAELGREIDSRVEGPGQRYGTTLLDLAPAGTTIYVAIPNLSTPLGQAYDLMQEKISENELLREWWDESVVASGADTEIERAMEKIRAFGRQLGDEIVVTVGGAGDEGRVLILSQLRDPGAFRELLDEELARLKARGAGDDPGIVVVDDLDAAPASGGLYLWIGGDLLVASPNLAPIRGFAQMLERGRPSSFYGSPFHRRLADLYAEGVEWVIGLDVENLRRAGVSTEQDGGEEARLEALGILDLQHVIAQRREFDGRAENRAVLTFNQPRRGVAAWLAEPAPMGALDFVSPDAYFATAFVMKEPAQVVDEMIGILGSSDGEFVRGLDDFEREYGIDVREDIAAAIGGEFAFAVDGPLLPEPSWKLVVEVYDPVRLQGTLEWAAGRLNDLAREHGRKGFVIDRFDRRGRTFYELKSLDTGISAHYTFADGYLVASASRALVDRALQLRSHGVTIVSNPKFRALLPHDARVNFSAVLFQNWGSVAGPFAERLRQSAASGDQEGMFLGELGALSGPNLTLAYGEPSRITLVNTAEGGLLGRSLTAILSLQNLMNVQQLLDHAAQEQAEQPPARGPAAEVRARGDGGAA